VTDEAGCIVGASPRPNHLFQSITNISATSGGIAHHGEQGVETLVLLKTSRRLHERRVRP
jgi:hypothetical protein